MPTPGQEVVPDILVVAPIHDSGMAELEGRHRVHRLWQAPDRGALLDAIADKVEVVVTNAFVGCDAGLMARLPRLRLIASSGVGYDSIDLAAARARGVTVANTPGVLDDDVADFAIGLVLATARRLPQGDAYVRAGRWAGAKMALTTRVSGKRLGILGLGRIGQAIARRAAAFDMPIAYHGPRAKAGFSHLFCPTAVGLARWSDILVVACPGGPSTRGLVGAEVLTALGPSGFLINIARGSVVDEPALIAALREGQIAGAGLDVFADEPNVPAELLDFDNVVVQPHAASATEETRGAMARLVAGNVRAYFEGRPLLTPVP